MRKSRQEGRQAPLRRSARRPPASRPPEDDGPRRRTAREAAAGEETTARKTTAEAGRAQDGSRKPREAQGDEAALASAPFTVRFGPTAKAVGPFASGAMPTERVELVDDLLLADRAVEASLIVPAPSIV